MSVLKRTVLVRVLSEEPNCSGAISKRKHTSYNLAGKLDIIHHKSREQHTIDTACALQIPVTIHTILNNAQEIETGALNLLKHLKVKSTHQNSDMTEVMNRHQATCI
jgi:hypothetical protein